MTTESKVNSWDEFQPLEKLILGSVYDSSFFNDVKNAKIRSALKRIVDETNEDLEYFKDTVKSHGIEIYQATPTELGYKTSILDYVNNQGELGYKKNNVENNQTSAGISNSLIPNPPLQPRDDSIVMGNKLLVTDTYTYAINMMLPKFKEWLGEENIDLSIDSKGYLFERSNGNLKNFLSKNHLEINDENLNIAKENHKIASFCSPNLTRIGKSCLVDLWQVPGVVEEFLNIEYPEFNYKKITIGGHNDSVFSVIKPGVLIATRDLEPHKDLFKDWEIIWFEDPNWNLVKHWKMLRHKNQGKWWVPGEEQNDEFTSFVETFLPNWTGFVEETIFAVSYTHLTLPTKRIV